MRKVSIILSLSLFISLLASTVLALDLVPYNFTAGSPAVADSVDANFTALEAAIPAIATEGSNDLVLIDGTNLTSDYTTLNNLTVTAPGDGVVLVLWSGFLECLGTDNADEIRLYVNGAVGGILFNVETCTASGQFRSVSGHDIVPVSNSLSYTFQIRGHDFYGDANQNIRDSRMTLLFIPFGFDGNTATVSTGISPLTDTSENLGGN